MQTSLFETSEKIRTLGFYEPFGSLMLHNKVETRWVRKGKKPPFPLSKYLFYTTQQPCSNKDVFDWCGLEIMLSISETLGTNKKSELNGFAIAVGELVEVRPLTKEDEGKAFVKFIGEKTEVIKGEKITKVQWALIFKDVKPITPFRWEHGKQGVGFLPEHLYSKLQ